MLVKAPEQGVIEVQIPKAVTRAFVTDDGPWRFQARKPTEPITLELHCHDGR